MRKVAFGLALAVTVAASPAFGAPDAKPTGKIILFQPTDFRADGDLPTLTRGEQFGVACGCMGRADADIRVILNLASTPSQLPTGYKRLMATDQRVENGALRVRVPDAPGLANHTVDVQVYVVGSRGAHACDAGRIKIS